MPRPRTRKPLSPLEHLLLSVLWKKSSATAFEVTEALAPTKPLKESTVRTVLSRLEEKGYVRHKIDGRTNIYSPTEPPANVAVCMVRQVIDRFCGGSVQQLLIGMVDEQVIDKKELQALADRLAKTPRKDA